MALIGAVLVFAGAVVPAHPVVWVWLPGLLLVVWRLHVAHQAVRWMDRRPGYITELLRDGVSDGG